MRKLILVAVLFALLPSAAKANCTGFLDCLFGFTERTAVRAERDVEIARIRADQAEKERLADAEVERVRQQQFDTEAQRDIAIAQAEQQATQYKAMIAALVEEKVATIQAMSGTQIVALQEQSKIAQAGIREQGLTERWRIAGGWLFSIVAVIAVVIALAYVMRKRTVVYLENPDPQYRLGSGYVREIEVRNANQLTKR